MKCRGENTRKRIVGEYFLKPIAHVRLLKGQSKKSCTGDILTDQYYCFYYTHKKNSQITGTFFCGKYAAEHFLKLLNKKPLPLFDPLEGISLYRGSNETKARTIRTDKWNPVAKQLYEAIHLLIICWDTVPGKVLSEIKEKLERYFNNEPFLSQIKAVNTIISKDNRQRTLQEMIDELRSAGNNVKEYKFYLLNEKLLKQNIKSYFG